MDIHEEDRVVAALRAASALIYPGVSDRIALCRIAAKLLGWNRVTAKKWTILDHCYRLALHRKVWLRQSEGAHGPYPFGDPRPIARYSNDELTAFAREALERDSTSARGIEAANILARYLGFTEVSAEDLAVLAEAVKESVMGTQSE
ncbi:MAG TPA: hypothetical protein VFE62_16175 [Gemmataceae bacterium]|nr:hypothetical protein [Gemmataceae bacterium]